MKPDQERVKILLSETISLLCKSGLNFEQDIYVQGLLGITVDSKEVFIVQLNETLTLNDGESGKKTENSAKQPDQQQQQRDGQNLQCLGDTRSQQNSCGVSEEARSFVKQSRQQTEARMNAGNTREHQMKSHTFVSSMGPQQRSPIVVKSESEENGAIIIRDDDNRRSNCFDYDAGGMMLSHDPSSYGGASHGYGCRPRRGAGMKREMDTMNGYFETSQLILDGINTDQCEVFSMYPWDNINAQTGQFTSGLDSFGQSQSGMSMDPSYPWRAKRRKSRMASSTSPGSASRSCGKTCSKIGCTLLDGDEKTKMSRMFRSLTHNEQSSMLMYLLMDRRRVKFRKNLTACVRECIYTYSVYIDQSYHEVCKNTFRSVFGLSEKRLWGLQVKMRNGCLPVDGRGKHGKKCEAAGMLGGGYSCQAGQAYGGEVSSGLNSGQLQAEQLHAEQLHVEQLYREQLRAEQLHAEQMRAEQMRAEQMRAEQMHSGQLHTDQMHSDQLHRTQMHPGHMHAEQMHAEQMHAEQMHAGQMNAGQMHAEQMHATQLLQI